MPIPANQPVLPLKHSRIKAVRPCESCGYKTAKHKLAMHAGPTYRLCENCVNAFKL